LVPQSLLSEEYHTAKRSLPAPRGGHRSIVEEMLQAASGNRSHNEKATTGFGSNIDFGIRVPRPAAGREQYRQQRGGRHAHSQSHSAAEELFKQQNRGTGDRRPGDPIFELGRQQHQERMQKRKQDERIVNEEFAKLPDIKGAVAGSEHNPIRAKTHLGHYNKARGVKQRVVGNGGHVDLESRLREERHMAAFLKLKKSFDNPKLPPLIQSHGGGPHGGPPRHSSEHAPDLVWHYKNSYGMSVEKPTQTELSSTFIDDTVGKRTQDKNDKQSALASIERPYLKLRTHWATHSPDERESRAVRQQRGMAFYGSSEMGTQTELSDLNLVCQEGDNLAWRLDHDAAPIFVSLGKSQMMQPEAPDLSPGGMAHVDKMLSELEWYN